MHSLKSKRTLMTANTKKKMSKYEAHIPTEQYGFVTVQAETVEEVREEYNKVKVAFDISANGGLDAKAWRNALDRYLKDQGMDSETYLAMNKLQQHVIQELKKAFKRITN